MTGTMTSTVAGTAGGTTAGAGAGTTVGGGGTRIFRARRGTISGERSMSTCRLAALRAGERGRVVRVTSASAPLLQKLLAMAIVPGSEIRVDLAFPAFVFEVGNTRVAVDRAIAQQIEVERIGRGSRCCTPRAITGDPRADGRRGGTNEPSL